MASWIGLALLGGGWLHAQTYIWTGLGLDGSVTTPANWQGGAIPPDLASSTVVFGNALRQSVFIPVSRTVGNVSFTGTSTSYQFDADPQIGTTLTLAGNVSSAPGSSFQAMFTVPLSLAAGVHNFATEGLGFHVWSAVGGTGSILKTGAGTLSLEYDNTYSGGTVINQGTVAIGANGSLGTGPVTLNGGTLANWTMSSPLTLTNNFSLGTNPIFDVGYAEGSKLTLMGTISALGPTVKLRVMDSYGYLQIQGNILDIAGPPTIPVAYTFYGGTVVLKGANTYSGGTTIGYNDGTNLFGGQVVFGTATSIPASGTIKTSLQGYAGLGAPAAMATFLDRLDRTAFQGVVGFDTDPSSAPQAFSANIDLSGGALPFSNPNLRIGTITEAILYGQITLPVDASAYSFSGSGRLFLFDAPGAPAPYPLTGTRNLIASTFDGSGSLTDPFLLVLRRPNSTYSGTTTADRAGIIFDAVGALPSGSILNMPQPGGYLGVTQAATDVPIANLVSRIGSSMATGGVDSGSVLGFDSHDYVNNLAYPSGVNFIANPLPYTLTGLDLNSLPMSLYIGTASRATLTGTITTAVGGTEGYYFTGYNGGALRVESILGGTRAVHVGLPSSLDMGDSANSSVTLAGSNTYSGGTMFNSGQLFLSHNNALGSGPLTVATSSGKGRLIAEATVSAFANSIGLFSNLALVSYNPAGLSLPGVISGTGKLYYDGSTPLTLSGNNSFSGGLAITSGGTVTAGSNTAFGSGVVSLDGASNIVFSTAAPVVGGLSGGYPYFNGESTVYSTVTLATGSTLTINQPTDDDFAANISGSGAIIKSGAYKLALSGNNTYTGGTTITQGKLRVDTSTALGSGNVTINGGSLAISGGVTIPNPISFGAGGGILGGDGTLGGSIAIGSNVTLNPGASPGTLNFTGALTWAGTGSYNIEVFSAAGNQPGISYDTIVVSPTGSFTITATSGSKFNLNLLSLGADGLPGSIVDFNSANSYSWQIASSTNPIANFSAGAFSINTSGTGNFTNALNGGSFSVSLGTAPLDGSSALFLNFTPAAVPEPATWVLLLSGLGLAATVRRRRA